MWKDLRKKAIRARLWREWNYDRKRKDCSDYSCSQYPGCSVYVIAGYLRKKEKKFSIAMKAMVMLLCPVVGAVFLALGELFFRLFFAQAMDLDDVIFSKDRVKTYLHPDEERERNLVSVEEALVITDKENLRELMLNVVRGDVRNSLASLSMALNSEDSETGTLCGIRITGYSE